MKYTITKEQRHLYETTGAIEFEDFFTEEEIALLYQKISRILTERKKVALLNTPSFAYTRDISRENEEIKQVIFSNKVLHLALQLSFAQEIRFGYDQLYVVPDDKEMLFSPLSLTERSSVSSLVCAMMIALESNEESSEVSSLLPQKREMLSFFIQKRPGRLKILFFKNKNFFL